MYKSLEMYIKKYKESNKLNDNTEIYKSNFKGLNA